MSDQYSKPKKHGVHGWRAFFLVFGCGSLAAFLVFGSLYGVARIIISGSSSSSSEESQAESMPSREPRETTEPGVLDVCEKGVEASGMLSNPEREDEGDEPIDTATANPDATPRTVEDECIWSVIGEDGSNQTITLGYKAFMSDSDERSKIELAEEDFSDKKEEVESGPGKEIAGSPFEGASMDEHYVVFDDASDTLNYSLVGRKKSAVFVINLEGNTVQSDGNATDKEGEYSSVVREIIPYIESNFERIVPD